ncbi:MAG: phytanoyl-CoA dioxygenase family protein [Opitutaceae bacterium]|nr:phytanoyl-CoA dioxygenase family protein [Opitutaceae bacterium]MBP9913982.1 phytanoyl-CoA dioxygenase family protein [Opitutaceae bacterium]
MPSPLFPATPDRTTLSADDLARFHERGYHIQHGVFSDAEIAVINAAADKVIAQDYDKGAPPDNRMMDRDLDPMSVIKIDNTWKADTTMAAAALSPRIGHIAAQLIGAPGIRMWHDQLLDKPALGGRVITWHQDWAYWQMIAECETVTCWIALDDVRPDSGPMVFLEGSQKLGIWSLPVGITGDDAQKPGLPADFKTREVPVIIPKGSVSFHHGLLLHGSDRNFSTSRRRAFVSHVMSTECSYKPGQIHMNEWKMKEQPDCPRPGEKFHGPQFPVMWPAGQSN